MEVYSGGIELISVYLFNKLLTIASRKDDKYLYESINIKVMIALSKLLIENVRNVPMLLEIQLIFESKHFSSK